MTTERTGRDDGHAELASRTPWLEWAAAGVGLLLTLGVFGAIGWQALHETNTLPVISVEVDEAVAIDGGYRIEFRARNTAGATAAQVEILGTLAGDGGEVETSRVILDYIPGHSIRKGGMFFKRDPHLYPLVVRASGFATP